MSARITIPLDKAHEIITETVKRTLHARGLKLALYDRAGARIVGDEQVDQACVDIGRNAAQALCVIDETPIDEIDVEYEESHQPRVARARGRK